MRQTVTLSSRTGADSHEKRAIPSRRIRRMARAIVAGSLFLCTAARIYAAAIDQETATLLTRPDPVRSHPPIAAVYRAHRKANDRKREAQEVRTLIRIALATGGDDHGRGRKPLRALRDGALRIGQQGRARAYENCLASEEGDVRERIDWRVDESALYGRGYVVALGIAGLIIMGLSIRSFLKKTRRHTDNPARLYDSALLMSARTVKADREDLPVAWETSTLELRAKMCLQGFFLIAAVGAAYGACVLLQVGNSYAVSTCLTVGVLFAFRYRFAPLRRLLGPFLAVQRAVELKDDILVVRTSAGAVFPKQFEERFLARQIQRVLLLITRIRVGQRRSFVLYQMAVEVAGKRPMILGGKRSARELREFVSQLARFSRSSIEVRQPEEVFRPSGSPYLRSTSC